MLSSAERTGAIREDREQVGRFGRIEHAPDAGLQRGKAQAAATLQCPGHREQDLQARAADVGQVAEVEHEIARTRVDQILHREFEIGGSLVVEAPSESQYAHIARGFLADRKGHLNPPGTRSAPRRSGSRPRRAARARASVRR
jgi:hypothetical protein